MDFNDDDNLPVDPFAMPEPLSVGNEVMAGMPLPSDVGPDGKTAEEAEVKGIYSPDLINKVYNTNGGNVTESQHDNGEEGENILNEITKGLDGEDDDEEIKESIEEFRTLNSLYQTVVSQGISKDLVYQVEALAPNIITSKIRLSRISSVPSQSGYSVSVESIRDKLKEIVTRIIDAIIERFNRIKAYIREKLMGVAPSGKAESGERSSTANEQQYKEVLERIKARAAEKGTKAFFADLSSKNDPNAMKASDAKDYLELTMISYIKEAYGSQINLLQSLVIKNPSHVRNEIFAFMGESNKFTEQTSNFIKQCSQKPFDDWKNINVTDKEIASGDFGVSYTTFKEMIQALSIKQSKLTTDKGKIPSDINVENLSKFEYPFAEKEFMNRLNSLAETASKCNEHLEKIKKLSTDTEHDTKPENFDKIVQKIMEASSASNAQISYVILHRQVFHQFDTVFSRGLAKLERRFKHS